MSTRNEGVSAVIPAYNAGRYLPMTVLSALDQDLVAEVIVVNDGSTDETPLVLDSLASQLGPRFKYLSQENSGVSAARNRGLANACQPLVAFLDADDYWLPQKLSAQVPLMLASKSTTFVGSWYFEWFGFDIRRPSHPVSIWVESEFEDWIHFRSRGPLVTSTGLFRTNMLRKIGGWDEALGTAADLDLMIRLRDLGIFAGVEKPYTLYRMSQGQMHRNWNLLEKDLSLMSASNRYRHRRTIGTADWIREARVSHLIAEFKRNRNWRTLSQLSWAGVRSPRVCLPRFKHYLTRRDLEA